MGEPGVRRWLVPAMILIGLLLFLGLGRCGSTDSIVGAVPGLGPDRAKNPGSSPEPQTPGSTPGGGGSGSGPTGGGAAGPGTVTTGRGRLLPFPSGIGGRTSLARFSGDRAIGTDVRVQSVVANEGFWIGRRQPDRGRRNADGAGPAHRRPQIKAEADPPVVRSVIGASAD
jgi:hypothetical protein